MRFSFAFIPGALLTRRAPSERFGRLRNGKRIICVFGCVLRDAMQGVPKRRVAGLHKQGTTQQRARKTKDKYANYSFTVPYLSLINSTSEKKILTFQ
jgi:hypothetical protein